MVSIVSYSRPSPHSVVNVKALVSAFNQEKALVGAFSVIVKTDCETDGAIHSSSPDPLGYSDIVTVAGYWLGFMNKHF